ncbi:hypothetical protein, partial [Sphingobacterium spiritivorum]
AMSLRFLMQDIESNYRFEPEAVAGFEHYRCGLRIGMRDATNPSLSAELQSKGWSFFYNQSFYGIAY